MTTPTIETPFSTCGHEQIRNGHRQRCTLRPGHLGLCGPYLCLECPTERDAIRHGGGDLADRLPEHIRHYVASIRPHMMGDQYVVEFRHDVQAIDENDLVAIAALLVETS